MCKTSFILNKHFPVQIRPHNKSVLHFSPLKNKERAKLEGIEERKDLGVKKKKSLGRRGDSGYINFT